MDKQEEAEQRELLWEPIPEPDKATALAIIQINQYLVIDKENDQQFSG
jgi:hypothetical protein